MSANAASLDLALSFQNQATAGLTSQRKPRRFTASRMLQAHPPNPSTLTYSKHIHPLIPCCFFFAFEQPHNQQEERKQPPAQAHSRWARMCSATHHAACSAVADYPRSANPRAFRCFFHCCFLLCNIVMDNPQPRIPPPPPPAVGAHAVASSTKIQSHTTLHSVARACFCGQVSLSVCFVFVQGGKTKQSDGWYRLIGFKTKGQTEKHASKQAQARV